MALKSTRCFIQLPANMTLTLGKEPSEPLVASTVAAALRITRDRAALAHVLPHWTAWLVRETLTSLAGDG
jgi:hypothetical protein